MVIGMGSYIMFDRLLPNALGMHTVVLPIFLSLIAYVIVSLISHKTIRPKKRIFSKENDAKLSPWANG
jgi:sodium/pantothenate symporter